MLFLILAALLLSSCGRGEEANVNAYKMNRGAHRAGIDVIGKAFLPSKSDGRLIPYVKRYERDVEHIVRNVPVTFSTDIGAAGYCQYNLDGTRQVVIDQDSWEHPMGYQDSPEHIEVFREIVLFHELTHCVRNFSGHIKTMSWYDVDGESIYTPDSIMHPSADIDPRVYIKYRQEFINRLKTL